MNRGGVARADLEQKRIALRHWLQHSPKAQATTQAFLPPIGAMKVVNIVIPSLGPHTRNLTEQHQ